MRGFNYRNVHYNAVMPPRTNTAVIVGDGRSVQMLNDVLPESPGLDMLFVGKTPASESVRIGHYFQGKQGRWFWTLLREYGIFEPTTEFEDHFLAIDMGLPI